MTADLTGSLFHPANVAFLTEVEASVGGLAEIALASADPDEAVAAHFKVSRTILSRWVLAKGRRSCAFVKPRGGVCQNRLTQRPDLDPKMWAEAPDALCSWHAPR